MCLLFLLKNQRSFLVNPVFQEKNDYHLLLSLLLLLLSHFSHVRLCATPWMAAHQAPPSLGFSRQEHRSGLPFPSPMRGKWKVKVKTLSRVRLLATPWTAAYQAPPSMGFSRQEYWSGVPLPSSMHESEKWKSIETVRMMVLCCVLLYTCLNSLCSALFNNTFKSFL